MITCAKAVRGFCEEVGGVIQADPSSVGGVLADIQSEITNLSLLRGGISRGQFVFALDTETVVGDEISVFVLTKISGAGGKQLVGGGVFHEEKALAVHRHIGAHASVFHGTLGKGVLDGGHSHAVAYLHTRCTRSGGGVGRGGTKGLGKGILKLHAGALVGDGVNVGKVVTNHIQAGLELAHAKHAGV